MSAAVLAACGGSGSSSSSSNGGSGTVNNAPVISAGSDQISAVADSVSLSGTASDSDGDALTYSWAQTSGTSVTLSNSTTLAPSFDAPSVDTSEDLVFTLTVSDGSTNVTDTVTVSVFDTSEGYVQQALFSSDLVSMELVSCQLESGTSTACYEVVFPSNTVGSFTATGSVGPFCPATTSTPRSEGGVGVYDGETNPGFLPMVDAALAMETDGYDIIDDDGNIYVANPGSQSNSVPDGSSACLEAAFDNNLEITYLIPAIPEVRSSNYTVQSVGNVGLGKNGIPLKGVPPSVIDGPGMGGGTYTPNIPSLDPCGGHADPSGYYHWHFIPQATNDVLGSDAYDYTAQYGIECGNFDIETDEPYAFSGFAQDGYPIYGSLDLQQAQQVEPSEVAAVDECNGHTHETTEYPLGAYHYHALNDTAPNMPTCLKGSYSNSFVTIR